MTGCPKLYESVEKRLEERKSIKEIGKEMCPFVKDPVGKVIRLIKITKGKDGQKYLEDNKEWLKYTPPHNPKGKNKKAEPKKFGSSQNSLLEMMPETFEDLMKEIPNIAGFPIRKLLTKIIEEDDNLRTVRSIVYFTDKNPDWKEQIKEYINKP